MESVGLTELTDVHYADNIVDYSQEGRDARESPREHVYRGIEVNVILFCNHTIVGSGPPPAELHPLSRYST